MAIDIGLLIGGPLTDIKLGAAGSEVSLGPTLAGLAARKEVGAFREFRTQQSKGILKKEEASGVRYVVSTVLAHVTMDNLRIAMNQIAANLSGSTLTVDEDEQGVLSLVCTGPGPNGLVRTLEFHKVISIATGDVQNIDQDAQQGVPVEFEVLQDASTLKWFTVRN